MDEQVVVTVWTTAPEAYDYGSVLSSVQVGKAFTDHVVRRVEVASAYYAEIQMARYQSGMYPATTSYEDVERSWYYEADAS